MTMMIDYLAKGRKFIFLPKRVFYTFIILEQKDSGHELD